jgi:hypothetical protein
LDATVVGTAHKPGIPATQTLGRQRRSSQNALQSLDLDTEPGDHGHRDRYTTSTGMTLGDGALAVFDGPSRAISSATAIRDRVRNLEMEIRAGLHTGECELLPDDDVGGIAVHIGARVSSLAGPGEVLVSSTVRDLIVGSGQTLTDRGEHDLKGVPGPWRVFAVET